MGTQKDKERRQMLLGFSMGLTMCSFIPFHLYLSYESTNLSLLLHPEQEAVVTLVLSPGKANVQ